MMLAEAGAAAPLNHPGLATIYEVSQYNRGFYIAMELVSGKNLGKWQENFGGP